jgi:hypothetical protein
LQNTTGELVGDVPLVAVEVVVVFDVLTVFDVLVESDVVVDEVVVLDEHDGLEVPAVKLNVKPAF